MHACSCRSLDHLDRMTDSTGLMQHAIYTVPRKDSGYTTNDNARALRLCAKLYASHQEEHMLQRVMCYLSFLSHANCPSGEFHNFMSAQREWQDDVGSGDSQGQAVLALAQVIASNLPQACREVAWELMDRSLPVLKTLTSLRAHAYVIQAWAILWRANIANSNRVEHTARESVQRLVDAYHHWQHPNWQWFESRMTYANAVLPHAMFDAAERWPDEEFLSLAEESFRFLDEATTSTDVFWPIGIDGWNDQDEERQMYDQQPVEASTMAAAACAAMRLQHHQIDLVAFQKAHGWFLGQNSLRYLMADLESGGCLDGLESAGVNRNQGAESTLAYLWTELLAFDVQSDSMPFSNASSAASPSFKLQEGFKTR